MNWTSRKASKWVSFLSTFFPTMQGGVLRTAGLGWTAEERSGEEEHTQKRKSLSRTDCSLVRQTRASFLEDRE